MSSEKHTEHHDHAEHDTMTRGRIVRVFIYLLAITVLEFAIALIAVPHGLSLRIANPVYILLTLLKAFYIVAFFMHLKFEKAGLVYTLVIPIIFIIGLILVLTNESNHWVDLRG
ncbi:cytochrome C oxidase subunit IV family protein [Mucilaginibacter sp. Bleaf8]|uniref:cytochrome C oxidase subunit IV family protein n=1 Tax=Mucilaginibacter sp. Bleaf8 TaxID=2834430 RepID=UPI001BCD1595|nr:cytochrome C oxidase subunit IV family protein [Mucilaginibacter sp. Bleaf8]MBS7566128.1 cytochrome C oxidase subunit IV family protein [Mucilaginibacter sp. Bleaf8]